MVNLRRFLSLPLRACEHCGKWQSGKICRRDRRRIKEARQALAVTGRAPWYSRAWHGGVWVLVGLVLWLVMLLTWDDKDPFY